MLLNTVFLLFTLITIAALIFYFYKLAHHDKEEWLKKEMKLATEEKEAEEWLHSDFVPQLLHYVHKNQKKVIKFAFVVLLLSVFLWTYAIEGLYGAARNAFIASVGYAFLILYVYMEPHFFSNAKDHLPRKWRHSFDNDWIRAYVFFLPPACIIYLFMPKPLSFTVYLMAYTVLFLALVAATRLSVDFDKEDEHHRKKLIKKSLDENS